MTIGRQLGLASSFERDNRELSATAWGWDRVRDRVTVRVGNKPKALECCGNGLWSAVGIVSGVLWEWSLECCGNGLWSAVGMVSGVLWE